MRSIYYILISLQRLRLSRDAVHNGALQHAMLVRELDALLQHRRKIWANEANFRYQASKLSVVVDTNDVRKIINGDRDMNELLQCKQRHRHTWPMFPMLTHADEQLVPLAQGTYSLLLLSGFV
jgi:hypothetical protein